jgi:hypothetical protein
MSFLQEEVRAMAPRVRTTPRAMDKIFFIVLKYIGSYFLMPTNI